MSCALYCTKCCLKCENRDILAMHMLEHSHAEVCNEKKQAAEELRLKPISGSQISLGERCHICGQAFSDRQMLAVHMIIHSHPRAKHQPPNVMQYACAQCGIILPYEEMIVHKKTKHPLDLSMSRAVKRTLENSQTERVKSHSKIPTKDALAQQPITVLNQGAAPEIKVASKSANKQLHEIVSNEEPVYCCNHCSIFFVDRAMYQLHMGLHNHNSPWQCNMCGKVSSNALEFAAHAFHT